MKIEKCPFCGGESLLRDRYINGVANTKHYIRECRHCKATFANWYRSIKKANEAWNRRAKPENARQRALQAGICPMCEDCPDGCPVETPKDSRNKPENEPLTLGELRQMDGEPVWIVTLDGTEESMWEIIVSAGEYGIDLICVLNGVETRDYANFDLYNKTWLAYRSKPKEEHHEDD